MDQRRGLGVGIAFFKAASGAEVAVADREYGFSGVKLFRVELEFDECPVGVG